jgi:uncharacterized protein (DUF2252 family)
MDRLNPSELARRQVDRDRRALSALKLADHKAGRMQASALAFLRGTAPLYYEILAARPDLEAGPPGEGWLAGDLHVENFGVWRPEAPQDDAKVVFDLNDFDDAVIGPWRWDVLRLATSVLLGARAAGQPGPRALELAQALLAAHARALGGGAPPEPPPEVTALLGKVRGRTRRELLDARTERRGGGRRFVRGPRYRELPAAVRKAVGPAFARFVEALPPEGRPDPDAFDVVDAAFRVAGTGSLGKLRIAVLVRGKGGPDGGWIFDLKEQGVPSAAALSKGADPEPRDGAWRVVRALRESLPHPPRMAGTTRLAGKSLLVRRLAPQEDKLALAEVAPGNLEPLSRLLGALAGAMHRRGARTPPKAWTAAQQAQLLGSAVELAGLHEAAYLHYCQLTR